MKERNISSPGSAFTITAFRGSTDGELHLDSERGIFFSTDEAYASEYGDDVRKYEITLKNACVVSEAESLGNIEIDRETLISQGYDGRAIIYDNGEIDLVAFHLDQIREDPGYSNAVTHRSANSQNGPK